MSIDWSLAPEEATHYLPAKSESHCEIWLKIIDGVIYGAGYTGASGFAHTYTKGSPPSIEANRAIPLDQPKPWSGPEDGLPPVGTKCRVVKVDGIDAPLDAECKIVAHEMNGENMVAVYMHGKAYAMYVGIGISHCFSLTKAPCARETAIRELMDIAQVDCRVTAARLVDAGFKR